jgi:hypothetical protein
VTGEKAASWWTSQSIASYGGEKALLKMNGAVQSSAQTDKVGLGGNDVLSWTLLAADWAVWMWLGMDIC